MAVPSATVATTFATQSQQHISDGNNISQQPIMALTSATIRYIKWQ